MPTQVIISAVSNEEGRDTNDRTATRLQKEFLCAGGCGYVHAVRSCWRGHESGGWLDGSKMGHSLHAYLRTVFANLFLWAFVRLERRLVEANRDCLCVRSLGF
ncbi:hypothetical protein THAOC_04770, partial [Thalassiosira oceanica]